MYIKENRTNFVKKNPDFVKRIWYSQKKKSAKDIFLTILSCWKCQQNEFWPRHFCGTTSKVEKLKMIMSDSFLREDSQKKWFILHFTTYFKKNFFLSLFFQSTITNRRNDLKIFFKILLFKNFYKNTILFSIGMFLSKLISRTCL